MSFQAYGGDPTGMSGYYHYGNGGLGWTGSLVPPSGVSFPSLLYNDVIANGWQTREVRWRHTGGTLPLLQVAEDGSIYHPTMPDGSYYATGIVSVDGEDVGTSTVTVTWGTVLGAGLRTVRMSPLKRTANSMARRPEILEDMDVDEEDNITFTFADELGSGETVAEAVTTCEVYSGTDSTPDLRDGSRQITSPTVKQRVVRPTANVVYLVSCLATTNLGRKLKAAGYLRGVNLS
jgi:hypothetical protein